MQRIRYLLLTVIYVPAFTRIFILRNRSLVNKGNTRFSTRSKFGMCAACILVVLRAQRTRTTRTTRVTTPVLFLVSNQIRPRDAAGMAP
jgi:hypothetical protein